MIPTNRNSEEAATTSSPSTTGSHRGNPDETAMAPYESRQQVRWSWPGIFSSAEGSRTCYRKWRTALTGRVPVTHGKNLHGTTNWASAADRWLLIAYRPALGTSRR